MTDLGGGREEVFTPLVGVFKRSSMLIPQFIVRYCSSSTAGILAYIPSTGLPFGGSLSGKELEMEDNMDVLGLDIRERDSFDLSISDMRGGRGSISSTSAKGPLITESLSSVESSSPIVLGVLCREPRSNEVTLFGLSKSCERGERMERVEGGGGGGEELERGLV